jgi:hypothetical protein
VDDYIRSTTSELLEERSSIESGKRRSFKVWDLQIELSLPQFR